MTPILIAAMTTIVLAAVFYTIAVFSERKMGVLNGKHLALFWMGLVFDITGTTLMGQIAGGLKADIHGILGVGAIVLMLIHSVWASVALWMNKEKVLKDFHKFSLAVWALWMAAFLTGFIGVGLRAMLQ
jgi:uncharacterized repeat protein (TIGR03987 family)